MSVLGCQEISLQWVFSLCFILVTKSVLEPANSPNPVLGSEVTFVASDTADLQDLLVGFTWFFSRSTSHCAC